MIRFALAAALALSFHDDSPGCGRRAPHPRRPEAPPATAQTTPANAETVTRYEDEAKQVPEELTIGWKAVELRRAAGRGGLVAVLTAGNPVIRIARSGAYELVSFNDPTDPSRRLIGWISGGAFDSGKDPGSPPMPKSCTTTLDCPDSECDAVVSTARSGLTGRKACH